jgi:hypothetical protein
MEYYADSAPPQVINLMSDDTLDVRLNGRSLSGEPSRRRCSQLGAPRSILYG